MQYNYILIFINPSSYILLIIPTLTNNVITLFQFIPIHLHLLLTFFASLLVLIEPPFILFHIVHNLSMMTTQKRIWSQTEDEVLRKLYEEQGLRNWSLIAKRMSAQFNLPRKSAKQCRQRYENHINMETAKVEWTIDEELKLINFHNEIGNKWSSIAQKIPGKSDNAVKNHFYSKLRKILRKLNSVIHTYFRKQFREININVIYKVVEACEELFKEKPNCDHRISLACREIQNKMLNLSMLKEEELDSQQRVALYRDVIRQIYAISKLYKRKSKKSRNSSIQAPNLKSKHKKQVYIVSNQSEQGYASEDDSAFEGEDSNHSPIKKEDQKPKGKLNQRQRFQESEQSKGAKSIKKQNQIVVKDEQQGIKDLLKDAGLLQYDNDKSERHSANAFKFSSRSSFKSYSEKNDSDNQFFEDSELQKGFYSKRRRRNVFRNIGDPSEKSEGEGGPGDFYFNC